MMRFFLLIGLFLMINGAFAQTMEKPVIKEVHTEWMVKGQDYWMIPVAQKGIYRISFLELTKNGFPNVFDTLNYQCQLFSLGVSIPLYTHLGKDLSSDSYLEFYGEGDEGKSDDLLFKEEQFNRLNPLFSLFTDTAYYFLSWQKKRNDSGIKVSMNDRPLLKKWEPATLLLKEQVVYQDRQMKVFQKWVGVDWVTSSFEKEGFASDWYNTLITEISAPGIANYNKFLNEREKVKASLNVHLITNDFEGTHNLQFFINGHLIGSDSFPFSTIKTYVFKIDADMLREFNAVLVRTTNGEYDKFAIGCVTLSYPAFETRLSHSFDILNKDNNHLPFGIQTKEKLTNLVIWDLAGGGTYHTQTDENGMFFVENGISKTNRKYFIQAENNVHWLNLPQYSTSLVALPPLDIDLLFISNPILWADKNGNQPLAEYLNYRKSATGGSFNPWLSNIKQLEIQYAYGIPNHPLAIRGFINTLIQHHYDLKAILLVGKGREYRDIRKPLDGNNGNSEENLPSLIPTWGYPGSDAMLVSSFENNLPWVSFGRIPAVLPEEITLFLKKVILFEKKSEIEAGWVKNVIQLGGGTYEPEKKYIREVLENFEIILDQLPWSPKTISFFKEKDTPVFIPYSRQFFDEVNTGVGLIIFLGHSTAGTFDFNIDNPGLYENGFKQPLFLSLGCYAGNHFTAFRSQGERFIFYPEGGAIAFAATRGIGFLHLLAEMGRVIIEGMKGESGFPSWGTVIHKGILRLMKGNHLPQYAMAQQLTFQGDPVVCLPVPVSPKPAFLQKALVISPHPVLVTADSFLLEWEMLHLGIEPLESLKLEISLKGSEEFTLFNDFIYPTSGENKIRIKCPVPPGINKGIFRLCLKYVQQSWKRDNGKLQTENLNVNYTHEDGLEGLPVTFENRLFIPLSPIDNGLLKEDKNFALFRTTEDISEQEIHIEWKGDKLYVEESAMASMDLENGVLHQTLLFEKDHSVVRGLIPFSLSVGEVYDWRAYPAGTSPDLLKILPFQSFTYDNLSQYNLSLSTKKQLSEGKLHGINWKEDGNKSNSWVFSPVYNTLLIRNKRYDDENPPEFIQNGQPIGSPWPWLLTAAIQVMVWDTIAGNWLKNPPGGLYHSKSNGNAMNAWVFDTRNSLGRQGLISFLEQGIPSGAYVSIYSAQAKMDGDYQPERWEEDALIYGKDLFSVLENVGATKIRELKIKGAVPYIFHFRKGYGKLEESIASYPNDIIYAQCYPSKVWHNGTFISPFLGPALEWKQLQMDLNEEIDVSDTVDVEISGFNPSHPLFKPIFAVRKGLTQGTKQCIFYADDFFLSEKDSLLAVKLGIPSGQPPKKGWPFFQVKLNITNRLRRTPLSLNKIQAVFLPLPEFTTNLKSGTWKDSLTTDADLSIVWEIENLSALKIDSLILFYDIVQGNTLVSSHSETFSSLFPFEKRDVSWQLPGVKLESEFDLVWYWGLPGNDFFPANNKGRIKGIKMPDRFKVDFSIQSDGELLQQGGFLSQRPQCEIEILITGDVNGTTLDSFNVISSLTLPNGLIKPIIWRYEATEIRMEKQGNGQKISLYWKPYFEQTGIYKMNIQWQNYSENWIFEVTRPQEITHFMNYPNPFSNFTRFQYTLSKGENIDACNIQIFSITGELVRQLNEAELGPLKAGTHLTTGGWDGKDHVGDALANGIYIYKVALLNKHLMGKMVLMNP
jgi:hypothetical protein